MLAVSSGVIDSAFDPRACASVHTDPRRAPIVASWRCFIKAEARTFDRDAVSKRIGRVPTHVSGSKVMSVNKDQVQGQIKEVGGMMKEVAGKLVGNEKLEAKGKVQKARGEAQAAIGDIKASVKDALKKA
jgi:uncharacterized protein YjbJ (UPF0337 family)